jgi:hypothetical protein
VLEALVRNERRRPEEVIDVRFEDEVVVDDGDVEGGERGGDDRAARR